MSDAKKLDKFVETLDNRLDRVSNVQRLLEQLELSGADVMVTDVEGSHVASIHIINDEITGSMEDVQELCDSSNKIEWHQDHEEFWLKTKLRIDR